MGRPSALRQDPPPAKTLAMFTFTSFYTHRYLLLQLAANAKGGPRTQGLQPRISEGTTRLCSTRRIYHAILNRHNRQESFAPLPSLGRHNPKPLLSIFLRGQFQVFLLDDLWGISTLQGHSLNIMGHSHTIADIRIPEFVGTHINAQSLSMAVEGLEQGLWSAPP
jgi:hypothetical protein